ncbi:TFIIS_C domain-containing protein [Cephalotus follicularis]|uniref:DNA-directed RNA polymerase subunit n=1 Tax=Cephalotus follicularis TaxID=3775 RepID=A0A1Q3AM12_CEPFO|nr:TFIIS_C domain-containing protein [Cephalotus follicularis]
MEYHRQRDFLFCGLCGTMLIFKSKKYAECPVCNFKRDAKEISGREISYTVTAEEIRRELGISLINEGKAIQQKLDKECEKCHNPWLWYYARQMRSADEGQTTFYTCDRCKHQFQEN